MIDKCSSLAAKWEQLSALIGIRMSFIESIKKNNPSNDTGCWNEALKQWITQNYNTKMFGEPSWRTLLIAIAKVDKLQFKKLATRYQGV